ncbi:cation/H(+) antiporter 11-like [Prosopis cineraria]|uniref:cation/H(+) antiporter 11-like n=1 Tax=Prosopis cineraria TaxID=364024 RepID=UPI00240F0FEF|nr:cation/H(+) antiporter 11-like [Prosopis cineraria]
MNMNANETLFEAFTFLNASNHDETYQVCIKTPPNIVSDGLWGGQQSGRTPMRSALPIFELQIIVIFAITHICHFFFNRLGLTLFFSQIMAGLILGPSFEIEPLNLNRYREMLFPFGSQGVLAGVTSMGYAFFTFITSVQMDFSMITRTGNRVWSIALIGLVAPVMAGLSCLSLFSEPLKNALGPHFGDLKVAVLSHSITSFPVVACLLNDLKIINSELGRLALTTALVSDIIGLTVVSLGSAMEQRIDGKLDFLGLTLFFAFVILIPLVSRPVMFWIIKRTPQGRPVKDHYIFAIIGMVLALGWISLMLHQQFVLGPFIFGLSVPEGPPLGSALVKKLQLFGMWFLLPIFVTTCAIKVDFSLDYTLTVVLTIVAFIILTHFVKALAYLLLSLCCKMPLRDGLTIALIMNCKGVVEIFLYHNVYDEKVLSGQAYGVLMASVPILASITQMSVKYLYDPARKYTGYQKRNIMSLRSGSELRMVACIHKASHISPITDFLDLCCPTEDSPITVDALHLIELVGRSLPVFVPHRLQKPVSGSLKSYSDKVILAFDLYERETVGASINTYTVISSHNLMHEDVCILALDKLASMIILPFHRRWSVDGMIESDDKNIRSTNLKLLERAPCSVGILVGRAPHPKDSLLRVAMVFLGGDDDREALCLAKRAARDPRVNLVVYHLVGDDDSGTSNLENILDRSVLKDVKQDYSGLSNVTYREISSNDGTQTSSFIREIVNGHDFFIVGRRHEINTPQTFGLAQWSEFPELGSIGDLLASSDYGGRASVFVVQQQVSNTKITWKF